MKSQWGIHRNMGVSVSDGLFSVIEHGAARSRVLNPQGDMVLPRAAIEFTEPANEDHCQALGEKICFRLKRPPVVANSIAPWEESR